jgi:DNA-binding transcriptional LysR family regulator
VRESSGDVRGRIKLSAPRTFADAPIGQSLIDFAVAHPEIVLEIQLDDRFVDLVEEGFDLAVRITRLENSSLIARRLLPFAIRLCASPEVIQKYGAPTKPQDLAGKPCVIDTNGRSLSNWPFVGDNGQMFTVSVTGRIEVNSPMAARAAAVSGLGWATLPDFIAEPDIKAGRLVPMLDETLPKGGGIFAVYPHRRYLPAKVRVLVDFLVHWFKTAEG